MTPTENIQLERIEEKIDTLNRFMATYTEKSIHCAENFVRVNEHIKTLYTRADWNRNKIIIFMAVAGVMVWVIDKLVKI